MGLVILFIGGTISVLGVPIQEFEGIRRDSSKARVGACGVAGPYGEIGIRKTD
jgi:hypothetical protein